MHKKMLFLVVAFLALGKSSFVMNNPEVEKSPLVADDLPRVHKPLDSVRLMELNATDFKYLALCEAIFLGDQQKATQLINESKIDLNEQIPYFGGSFLWLAGRLGKKFMETMLKNYGATQELLIVPLDADTVLLHLAAYLGQKAVVEKLLRSNPQLKMIEERLTGETALFLALRQGHFKTAKCMMMLGVDIAKDCASFAFLQYNPKFYDWCEDFGCCC